MEVYNSDRVAKIRLLVDKTERGYVDEVVHALSYCPGHYAAFYLVAVLSKVSREHGEKLVTALNNMCDPKPLEKQNEN